jgi:hypothetical protein
VAQAQRPQQSRPQPPPPLATVPQSQPPGLPTQNAL